MPITQDRMINLISAAQDHATCLADLQTIAASTMAMLLRQELTPQQAFDSLYSSILGAIPRADSIAVIARELEHFRHVRLPNIRKAERRAEIRRMARQGRTIHTPAGPIPAPASTTALDDPNPYPTPTPDTYPTPTPEDAPNISDIENAIKKARPKKDEPPSTPEPLL